MKVGLPLDRLRTLSPRERRTATLVGLGLGVLFVLVLPMVLFIVAHERRSDADELHAAVDAVQAARAQVRERQTKKDIIAARYASHAPALAGFLEQAARGQKLEVTDSVDRPEVPHGKRYVERNTVIHLKKAGMGAIARFLETIERSGTAVAITRLNVRKRSGEPDSYDVEVGVSAYDRSEAPAAAAASSSSTAPEEKKP